MRPTIRLAAIVAVAVLAGAKAANASFFYGAGSGCQPVYGSQSNLMRSSSSIYNWSGSNQYLMCPLVVNRRGTVSSVSVRKSDSTGQMACQLQSRDGFGVVRYAWLHQVSAEYLTYSGPSLQGDSYSIWCGLPHNARIDTLIWRD